MRELGTINSPESLEKSMRDDWNFQVIEKKKHGAFPKNMLPSKVYLALYDSPPFSHNRQQYLAQLDRDWRANHGEHYYFVFHFKGSRIKYEINNVENYEEAYDHAISKLIHEGIGISSIQLAKHLMNTGDLQFDYNKV